jgi:transcriptional regulator with XRE-family HTH domain
MELKEAFGKVLKRFRTTKDISQENLAFDAELNRTYISMLERGERLPSLDTIFKLAKALECKPSELVARVERYFRL